MPSIHGICFDNGMSGNCNFECEDFINNECDVKDEMISNDPNGFYESIKDDPNDFLDYYLDSFMIGVLNNISDVNKREKLEDRLAKELTEKIGW